MSVQLVFQHPQLVTFAGNPLTDHNRDPITATRDQIENAQRMADGTMRKYFIASKLNFSFEWENVPARSTTTVDGFWGAQDIEDFYNANPGSFTLVMHYLDGDKTYQVFFSSFENDLQSRRGQDLYTLTVGLEEA